MTAKITTVTVDLGQYAPVGSTVRFAAERESAQRFCLGVILPDGAPWVLSMDATSTDEVKRNLEAHLPGRTITEISIDEHNRIKSQYRSR